MCTHVLHVLTPDPPAALLVTTRPRRSLVSASSLPQRTAWLTFVAARAIPPLQVDPEALGIPDYPSIISRPMDLGTVRDRLAPGELLPGPFGQHSQHALLCALFGRRNRNAVRDKQGWRQSGAVIWRPAGITQCCFCLWLVSVVAKWAAGWRSGQAVFWKHSVQPDMISVPLPAPLPTLHRAFGGLGHGCLQVN